MSVNFFDSKYPIVCSLMNGASTLELALACDRAGIFPSLYNAEKNIEVIKKPILEFQNRRGHNNVLCALDEVDLLDKNIVNFFKNNPVSHIEIWWTQHQEAVLKSKDKIITEAIKFLHPIKFVRRTSRPLKCHYTNDYTIKGSGSAGFSSDLTLDELFDEQKKLNPTCNLIPQGGIGTADQIKHYIDKGAVAVGIGTLLAASQESILSPEVKEKIINSTSKDLHRFSDTNQRALILGNKEQVILDKKLHWNRNNSLQQGLYGDGKQGHIYAGMGIDHITEILPVEQIVEKLVAKLV